MPSTRWGPDEQEPRRTAPSGGPVHLAMLTDEDTPARCVQAPLPSRGSRLVSRGSGDNLLVEDETAPPLVGRSAELDALTDLAARARDECGQVAVIEGEAGIGKTRLLSEVLTASKRLGFQVFRAAAEELDGLRPFGPLLD